MHLVLVTIYPEAKLWGKQTLSLRGVTCKIHGLYVLYLTNSKYKYKTKDKDHIFEIFINYTRKKIISSISTDLYSTHITKHFAMFYLFCISPNFVQENNNQLWCKVICKVLLKFSCMTIFRVRMQEFSTT